MELGHILETAVTDLAAKPHHALAEAPVNEARQRFRGFAVKAQRVGREHRRAADQRLRDDALFSVGRDVRGAG